MRIRQLFSLFVFALMFAGSSAYAQTTTSADLIAAAAADGALNDAELAEISLALAAEGSSPDAIATALTSITTTDPATGQAVPVPVSAAQVATGLSSVGQTPAQVATTLQSSGVVAQGDTAAAQAAANTGNTNATAVATVAAATNPTAAPVTAANAATNTNLSVSGSGLITDSTGRAVVVKTAADQVQVIAAIVRNTVASGQTLTTEQQNNINSLVSSNPDLASAATDITNLVTAGATGNLDAVNSSANDVIGTLADNGIVVTPVS